MSINDCKIIDLPKEEDPRGTLTYIYNSVQVPFDVKRLFYIYDVPAGKDRGAHAHKECWQFIIAASGALKVTVDDGADTKEYCLDRPFFGLLVPPGIWAHEHSFTSGALCLVLASHPFDENDYIRDYDQYKTLYCK